MNEFDKLVASDDFMESLSKRDSHEASAGRSTKPSSF
jgi:hypothetical protein